MIKVGNKEIKNLLSEMTLKEFDECVKAINNVNLNYIERYLNVMEILGVEDIDDVSAEDLIEFIKTFDKEKFDPTPIPEKITINDVVYVVHKGEWKLSAKDLAELEKRIKMTNSLNMAEAMAIICKKEGADKEENYKDIHLWEKQLIFEKSPFIIFFPLIADIVIKLAEKTKFLYELNSTPS